MQEPVDGVSGLPRAHGAPAGRARLRARPEDFVVREWLGFEADGEGEHLLLRVRKRGANTLWVAKQLARLAGVHPREVGFAGLKDRDAIAEQAYTIPARSRIGLAWPGISGEGFEVLEARRTRRKLKRGALRGNEFEIALRAFEGDSAVLEQRLRTIAASGVPNYFGPQRFGRAGGNLALAQAWFAGGPPPADRAQRGFALSGARAAIFNAVLARRVAHGTWDELQPGEIVNLDGSGSIFLAPVIDEALRERCRRLDVHPTGPLWGLQKEQGATKDTREVGPNADLHITSESAQVGVEDGQSLERLVVEEHAALAEGLVRAGLQAERRALRAAVRELSWSFEGEDVLLRFRLQRGCFATAVLHELIDNAFVTELPESDE